MIQTSKGLCLTDSDHETFVGLRCRCGVDEMFALRSGINADATVARVSTQAETGEPVPDAVWCKACWELDFQPSAGLFGSIR